MSTYTYRRPFSLCVFEDCGSELLIKLLHFIGRQYFVRFAEAVAFVWRNTLVDVGKGDASLPLTTASPVSLLRQKISSFLAM